MALLETYSTNKSKVKNIKFLKIILGIVKN